MEIHNNKGYAKLFEAMTEGTVLYMMHDDFFYVDIRSPGYADLNTSSHLFLLEH